MTTATCTSQARTLLSVDDQVDLLLRQLKGHGELTNTLVLFTSDNGYLWGEHGRHSKFVPYEPSLRVPLLLRWDGHVASGRSSRLVSFVDILPTVLEAAGVTPDPARPLDGESLLQPSGRSEVFSEYFIDSANAKVPTWAALTASGYKYVETTTVDPVTGQVSTFREYYDRVNDPGELTNLLRDGNAGNDPPKSQLEGLANRLAAARTCRGSGCP